MASNPQIISDLKVIMEMDQGLELLSTYKGVPFVCKAKVENIQDDLVRLHSKDYSLLCLALDAQAKVLGSDYFEPAIAEVQSVAVEKGMIELTKFAYIGARLGERMIVRVEPRDPVQIHVESIDVKTVGELIDISISGIGMTIAHTAYNPIFKPGATIQINMNIPQGEIHVPGTVLSAVKTESLYRLSVRFAQDITQRRLIFKYLIDRRMEIEQEVRDKYQNCVQEAM